MANEEHLEILDKILLSKSSFVGMGISCPFSIFCFTFFSITIIIIL